MSYLRFRSDEIVLTGGLHQYIDNDRILYRKEKTNKNNEIQKYDTSSGFSEQFFLNIILSR